MIRRLIPLLAGLLAVQAAAVTVDVNLPLKELRLKDGMLFTQVAVRSINPSAGTVMLLVNKDLVSVRTVMLPDEVATRLKQLAPAQTKEEHEAEKLQEAADRKKAVENAGRKVRRAARPGLFQIPGRPAFQHRRRGQLGHLPR